MGGRMQQTWPTQDSSGNLDGKFLCENKKRKHMGDESSEEEEEEDRVFSCSSCPRKFSSQYALAGHRNVHRSEWEFLLPCSFKPSHLPNATIASKQQSPRNSRSILRNTSSTLDKPLPSAPRCPLINPMNKLKGPLPTHPMANPTNTLILANSADSMIGSSLGVPHHCTFLRVDHTHPLEIRVKVKPHGKSAVGVRCFPMNMMIHKPCQYRHGDMRSRAGPTSDVAPSCSSWTRNFISSFFQRGRRKVIETHDFFASTLAKERDNPCIDHSLEGVAMQPNNNGENESSVDIDLDLKL